MARAKKDLWVEERAARERGFQRIAGIDEAGRGPLAGPVVAACVILPFETDLPGVRDSKTLTAEQRERAYAVIQDHAEAIGVGIIEPAEIDQLNILRATHKAMRTALQVIPCPPDVALIDGLPVREFPLPQIALVKGDSRSASVAAASIIAKVTRDRLMVEYDATYPAYRFSEHKGYPTPVHLALLEEHGPCAIHRRSFAPVARLVEQPALAFGEDVRQLGASGETVAAAHLRSLGWRVLATRYHCREGEVDIVAQDGETLAFVEVKTRRGRGVSPAEAVDARKRARILAAAEAYLGETDGAERDCRFDVAEVIFGYDGLATVRMIRGAFMAGE